MSHSNQMKITALYCRLSQEDVYKRQLPGWPLHILGDVAVAADELPSAHRAPLRIAPHMVVMLSLIHL